MNTVVAVPLVGLNVLQNASKCTISKENMPKFFWGAPVGAFGASMRVLDRPDHISRPPNFKS